MSLEKAQIEKAEIDKAGKELVFPSCINCRSSEIEATEHYRISGSAKMSHKITLDCPECGYNETFSKGLGKE